MKGKYPSQVALVEECRAQSPEDPEDRPDAKDIYTRLVRGTRGYSKSTAARTRRPRCASKRRICLVEMCTTIKSGVLMPIIPVLIECKGKDKGYDFASAAKLLENLDEELSWMWRILGQGKCWKRSESNDVDVDVDVNKCTWLIICSTLCSLSR